MKKTEAETLLQIRIYNLKKWGYLQNKNRSGIITWAQSEQSISISSSFSENSQYILLQYILRNVKTGKEERHDQVIPLTSSACYFGGIRYWLTCSCERKVGVLYKKDGSFKCRNCLNLTHQSKNDNRRSGLYHLRRILEKKQRIKELKSKINTPFYNGKPTLKQKKLYRLYMQAKDPKSLTQIDELLKPFTK